MRLKNVLLSCFAALSLFGGAAHAELPVPCGACNGGVWVSSGSASLRSSTNALTIDQHTDRAILNWENFNIGAGNSVNFRQPSTSSIALNRIFQSDPSRILGSLSANGQVFLINQNGFLFGPGARVNTHTLVASSLGITDQVFESLGITGAINDDQAAFSGSSAGNIDIAAGAQLNAEKDGRIMIIAPEINNRGEINSPDGQVILAASHDKVYLEASGDADLRGLLVEVETGGEVNNIGKIVTERGNATLLGAAVNQNGIVRATTSTTRNGSVRLLARDNATTVVVAGSTLRTAVASRAGGVSLGEGSSTEVLLDSTTGESAADAQAQTISKVEIVAKQITLERDAQITATGGEIDLLAAENLVDPLADSFVQNDASIVLKQGASIDVSGANDAFVPFERNLVEVDLRGNELRDNPVNRNGPVRGETVVVDARRGTNFADVSAFIDATERSVSERLAGGGSVRLRSEGTIDLQVGSVINISGGKVDYGGGFNTASYLIREGALTPIAEADPGVLYDGVFNFVENDYEKWSVTERFNPFRSDPLWQLEAPYSEGADAGSLTVIARELNYAGRILAESTNGINQRYANGGIAPAFEQVPLGGLVIFGDENSQTNDFKLGEVILGTSANTDAVVLDIAALVAGGVSRLKVFSNSRIALASSAQIVLPDGGELALRSGNLDIAGRIRAPGGTVDLVAGSTASTTLGEASLTLASAAEIDVSGRWINDFQDIAANRVLAPLFTDAGQVSLSADGPLLLNRGSVINAIGGGLIDEHARLVAGAGGDVSLTVEFSSGTAPMMLLDGEILGYSLGEAGMLAITGPAFEFRRSQSPNPEAGVTQIKESFFADTGFAGYEFTANATGITVANGTTLDLSRTQLILGNDSLQGDVRFAELNQAGTNGGNELLGNSDPTQLPTDSSLLSQAEVGQLPLIDRSPVSLSLNLERAEAAGGSGEINVAAGVTINADPGATVSLVSDRDLFFDAKINAPASTVVLQTKRRESAEEGFLADQSLWLGSNAEIDVSGVFFNTPVADGFRQGYALDAGTITLAANRGYLVGESGAFLNLDGAFGVVDLVDESNFLPAYLEQTVTARAGGLNLRSGDGIFFNGKVSQAAAPIPGSAGGALEIDIDGSLRDTRQIVPGVAINFPTGPREIRIGGSLPTGLTRGSELPAALNGQAIVGASIFASTDIDKLTLKAPAQGGGSGLIATGRIVFDNDTQLNVRESLRLISPEIDLAGSQVMLTAPVVMLGAGSQNFRFDSPLSTSSGSLAVRGDLVAIQGQLAINGASPTAAGGAPLSFGASGDLVLAGAPLVSNASDIAGVFRSQSDIRLSAARIYPTSFTNFEVTVERAGGIISTSGGSNHEVPYSVAGTLNLTADTVNHGGLIAAPFGRIEINASEANLNPGSLLSVTGNGQEFLFGQTQFELDWLLQFSGINVVLDNAPQKSVSINADRIAIEAGAEIDLSGGGDLRAFEFVPGPGGSSDILDIDADDSTFAIVPRVFSQPLDPVVGFSADQFGETFIVAENDVVEAGEYAVLPAHYALLPNAYLIRRSDETLADGGIAANVTRIGTDGVPVVAGKFSGFGSEVADSTYSPFQVLSGEQVRDRAEYVESLAGDFFAGSAITPNDNGSLGLTAGSALSIAGIVTANGSGRSSTIDLVADRIAVVNRLGEGPVGSVEIRAQDLSRLGNGSVLLGGSRDILSPTQSRLNILSEQVEVFADASVIRNEIILAARQDIIVGENATLRASGAALPSSALSIDGEGAVLAVSASDLSLSRSGSAGLNGSIDIQDNARIAAGGSVILDASVDTKLSGRIEAAGANVALGGSTVAIGDTPVGLGGLALSRDILAGLDSARSLQLRSASTIDLYGSVNLSAQEIGFDSLGLSSRLGMGDRFNITAEEMLISSRNAGAPGAGSGFGNIVLSANRIDFAGGETGIFDFASASINTGLMSWSADTKLTVSSDLAIQARQFAPTAAANLNLMVDGNVAIERGSLPTPGQTPVGLGGQFELLADSVIFNTDAILPSGQVSIESTVGDVNLSGANFSLQGVAFDYDGKIVGSRGGSFVARSATEIEIDNTAIDVSGAGGAESGRITLEALDDIQLSASSFQSSGLGELSVLADTLDVAALLGTADNGFTGEFDLRLRNAGIALGAGASINAKRISLVSDAADITIAGSLLANDSINGGNIRVFAGNELNISNTANLSARGGTGHGGLIEFGSKAGTTSVDTAAIDTSGGNGNGGTVKVRAPIIGNDTDIAFLAASFTGVELLEVEAFSVSNGTLDNAINALNAFSGNLAPIATRLGIDTFSFARVVPGAEVQVNGNYVTPGELNLISRRFSGVPGVLTLRASGDVNINHDISDGIVNYEPFPGQLPAREAADVSDSWSYRLVSGADLQSADPLAAVRGVGDFSIKNNVKIRTGTGSIELSGGGDLNLLGTGSVIYTVGLNRGTGTYGPLITEAYLEADFLQQGGAIGLDFGQNINAVARDQLVNDWLARFEGEDILAGLGEFATGWGVNIGRFRQGIGTLGGGDIRARAGGNITELGIAAPTTGLPTGARGSAPQIAGGGAIDIVAGGDTNGGLVYAAKGNVGLRAGGSIKAQDASSNSIILALGNSRNTLEAGRDIEVQGVFDPFLVPQSASQGAVVFGTPVVPGKAETFFANYSSDAGIELISLAGTVRFDADVDSLADVSSEISITGSDRVAASIIPPNFRAVAHDGDIEFGRSFTLFPAPNSQFELLAGSDIGLFQGIIDSVLVNFSDADPAGLPSVSTPSRNNNTISDRLGSFDNATGTSHATTPLHLNDNVPVKIAAREGQLGVAGSQTLGFSFAKSADIFAGGGIQNVNLLVQHANASDLSVVESGTSITYPFGRNLTGFLSANVGLQLAVAGPGALAVVAKNDIDLGTAGGIVSLGNTLNPRLADDGADLIIIPGFGKTNNAEFVEYLVSVDPTYTTRLRDFVAARTGQQSGDPVAAFLSLDTDAQQPLLVDLFFEELVASGVDATTSGSDDYSRGFTAINTFFNDDVAAGNLSLLLSRIATIDGGDVNLLVPGGFINGGVATSTSIQKTPDQLGIVAQRQGDVNIFVRDDLLVNQSRVFTLDGGRIVIWSSDGDIDAGRGAKSAVSIPGLITTIDTEGNVVTEFPPAVEGSGIRAAVASPGVPPGDVFLFAPRGAVIAGDAGIGSAGNLTIGATEVVGADNIDVGGVSVGVPSADVASVAAGFTGASDSSTSAAKSAQDGAGESLADNKETLADALAEGALSFISVEVLGFGG